MTARILFLDIDGVLLSGRAWLLPGNRSLRARCADLLHADWACLRRRHGTQDPNADVCGWLAAHADLGRAARPATTKGHAITVHVAASHCRGWGAP